MSKIELTYSPAPAPTSTDITVSAAGWTSFYDFEHAYVMPEGLTGYIVSMTYDENVISIDETYTAGDEVPAAEPLLLKGAAGTYTLNYVDNEDEGSYDNILVGVDVEASTSIDPVYDEYYYFYGLTKGKGENANKVGFYWMNATGAPFVCAAHKAYLALPKDMVDEVKGFSFDALETAIKAVETKEIANKQTFNLQGQRVNAAQKGIYIVNGKKVVK